QGPPSNGHSSSHHKHPPLSYIQHMRPIQHHSQQNVSSSSHEQQEQQQQQPKNNPLPMRPLSGDISSFMIRSASTDFNSSNEYITKENNQMNNNKTPTKKSSFYKSNIQRDMSYDNIKSLTIDETIKPKSDEQHPSQYTQIKNLLTKKFHPSTTTINETASQPEKLNIKQKKRRTSFRHFSQFLKRSHSTNTDLSTIATNSNVQQQQQQ
ncbi:unnamed protein product, partial [Rotaria magnacalcarata]